MEKRIELRQITPADRKLFLKIYNDPTSRCNMEDDRVIIKKWYPYIGGKKSSLWFIIENEDGNPVGLFNSFVKDDKLFWGMIIRKEERRKGYARATIKSYLKIIDAKNAISYLECFYDNPAKVLYEELGYKETKEFRLIRERKYILMVRDNVNK